MRGVSSQVEQSSRPNFFWSIGKNWRVDNEKDCHGIPLRESQIHELFQGDARGEGDGV